MRYSQEQISALGDLYQSGMTKKEVCKRLDIPTGSFSYLMKRDWFTCQKCKASRSRKNPLHAHHIKPKSIYPDLILDISNGLTLCKVCHIKSHRGRMDNA